MPDPTDIPIQRKFQPTNPLLPSSSSHVLMWKLELKNGAEGDGEEIFANRMTVTLRSQLWPCGATKQLQSERYMK